MALEKLSALNFLKQGIFIIAGIVFFFFVSQEITKLGNIFNWNWINWIIFYIVFMLGLASILVLIDRASDRTEEEKEEADPNGLFK